MHGMPGGYVAGLIVLLVGLGSALLALWLYRARVVQPLRRRNQALQQQLDQSIQARQTMADQLAQETTATGQTKKRMTSIFESAPNGMLVVNQEGKITQANSMAAHIFRCQPNDLVGIPVEQLVPPELRAGHIHDREQFQAKPSKRMMGARRDLYGVRFDGSYVPLEVGLHPVDLEGGAEIVASLVDISQRKAYEERIHERNEALELSNRELQEFAFIASHDLREPLRKIIAFSTLLQEGEYGQFNEEGQTFSGYIVSAAQRMRSLLEDLLAYSRVTSQASPLRLMPLAPVLQDVLEDLQLAIEDEQATIEVGPLPEVYGDAVQMRQLFQNLISNALKYHHPERQPVIRISAEEDDSHYRLRVVDNGIGFEPVFAEQVFEVFKRLHDKQAYAGTGMGLAICRKIVQRHGGVIYAQPVVNEGTTMVIELPKQVLVDE
ncbi:sensor histidine kinase [Marinomonas ostreistagni]|uniref:sensor histidine kinase n=1 Tax=Marinomonas ostreistagni TaxID=359209 RepID=UPI00194F399B|nr:ATP-binding protein [Marinomonas ostreistagni]MBM6550557.1 PAS domain S-box protein [Marinomonas ostreistagni]